MGNPLTEEDIPKLKGLLRSRREYDFEQAGSPDGYEHPQIEAPGWAHQPRNRELYLKKFVHGETDPSTRGNNYRVLGRMFKESEKDLADTQAYNKAAFAQQVAEDREGITALAERNTPSLLGLKAYTAGTFDKGTEVPAAFFTHLRDSALSVPILGELGRAGLRTTYAPPGSGQRGRGNELLQGHSAASAHAEMDNGVARAAGFAGDLIPFIMMMGKPGSLGKAGSGTMGLVGKMSARPIVKEAVATAMASYLVTPAPSQQEGYSSAWSPIEDVFAWDRFKHAAIGGTAFPALGFLGRKAGKPFGDLAGRFVRRRPGLLAVGEAVEAAMPTLGVATAFTAMGPAEHYFGWGPEGPDGNPLPYGALYDPITGRVKERSAAEAFGEQLFVNFLVFAGHRVANRAFSKEARRSARAQRRGLRSAYNEADPINYDDLHNATLMDPNTPVVAAEYAYAGAVARLRLPPELAVEVIRNPKRLPAILRDLGRIPEAFVPPEAAEPVVAPAPPPERPTEGPSDDPLWKDADATWKANDAAGVPTTIGYHGYKDVYRSSYFTGVAAENPITGRGGVHISDTPAYAIETTAGGKRPWLMVVEYPTGTVFLDGARAVPREIARDLVETLKPLAPASLTEPLLGVEPVGKVLQEVFGTAKASKTIDPQVIEQVGQAVGDLVRASGFGGIRRFGGNDGSNDMWIADARNVRIIGGNDAKPPSTSVEEPPDGTPPKGGEVEPGAREREPDPAEFREERVSTPAEVESPAGEMVAPGTPAPVERNWRAGQNEGTVRFPDEITRDLFDLAAKLRYETSKSGRTTDRESGDVEALEASIRERTGLTEDEVYRVASETRERVREEMRGLKDDETREVGAYEADEPAPPVPRPSEYVDRGWNRNEDVKRGELLSEEKEAAERILETPKAMDEAGTALSELGAMREPGLSEEASEIGPLAMGLVKIRDAEMKERRVASRRRAAKGKDLGVSGAAPRRPPPTTLFTREAVASMVGWKDTARRMFPRKSLGDLTPKQIVSAQNAAIREAGISLQWVGEGKGAIGLDEYELVMDRMGYSRESSTDSENLMIEALIAASYEVRGRLYAKTLGRMEREWAEKSKATEESISVEEARVEDDIARAHLSRIYREIEAWDDGGRQGESPHPKFMSAYRARDAALGFVPEGSPADLWSRDPAEAQRLYLEMLAKSVTTRPEQSDPPDDPSDGQAGFANFGVIVEMLKRFGKYVFSESNTVFQGTGEAYFQAPKFDDPAFWWRRYTNPVRQVERVTREYLPPEHADALLAKAGSHHRRLQRRSALDNQHWNTRYREIRKQLKANADNPKEQLAILQRLLSVVADPMKPVEGASPAETRFHQILADRLPRDRAKIVGLVRRGIISKDVLKALPALDLPARVVGQVRRRGPGGGTQTRLGPGEQGRTGEPVEWVENVWETPREKALAYMFDFAGMGTRTKGRPFPAIRTAGEFEKWVAENGVDAATNMIGEVMDAYLNRKNRLLTFAPLEHWWNTAPINAELKENRAPVWNWFAEDIRIMGGAIPKWEEAVFTSINRTASVLLKELPARVAYPGNEAKQRAFKAKAEQVRKKLWRLESLPGQMLRGWTYWNYLGAMGLNPSSAIRNITQHLATMAHLGGPVEGQLWWRRGLAKMYITDPETGKRIENPLVEQLGLRDEALARSIMDDAGRMSSPFKRAYGRVVGDAMMSMFTLAEMSNRIVAALAAYERARYMLKDRPVAEQVERAKRYALEIVHKTQFDYRKGFAGRFYAGPLGHAAAQFGRFGIYQTDMIGGLMKRALFGEYDSLGYHRGFGPMLNYIASTIALGALTAGVVDFEEGTGPGSGLPAPIKMMATYGLEQFFDIFGIGGDDDFSQRKSGREAARWARVYPFGYRPEGGFAGQLAKQTLGELGPPVQQAAAMAKTGWFELTGSEIEKENARLDLKREFRTFGAPGVPTTMLHRIGRAGIPRKAVGEEAADALQSVPIIGELLFRQGELQTGNLMSEVRGNPWFAISEGAAWGRAAGFTSPKVANDFWRVGEERTRQRFKTKKAGELNEYVRRMIIRGSSRGEAWETYSQLHDDLTQETGEFVRADRKKFDRLHKEAAIRRDKSVLDRLLEKGR